jgi:hypothetical protein
LEYEDILSRYYNEDLGVFYCLRPGEEVSEI